MSYPNHNKPDRFNLYSELLAHFIRDVRKDMAAPNLPFVIGVMGVGGLKDESVDMLAFRRAMTAPAAMPEFKGNVVAVQTAPFWGSCHCRRSTQSRTSITISSVRRTH